MARPLSKNARFRREYCICVSDPHSHNCKYFVRDGYKLPILKSFVSRFPDQNISIYVLSDKVFSNLNFTR